MVKVIPAFFCISLLPARRKLKSFVFFVIKFHDALRTGIRDIGLTSLCTNLSICHSRIFRLTFIIYKMVSVLKSLSLPLFIPCNTSRSFPTMHIVTTLSLAHQHYHLLINSLRKISVHIFYGTAALIVVLPNIRAQRHLSDL
jgi:hypothetical protein